MTCFDLPFKKITLAAMYQLDTHKARVGAACQLMANINNPGEMMVAQTRMIVEVLRREFKCGYILKVELTEFVGWLDMMQEREQFNILAKRKRNTEVKYGSNQEFSLSCYL